MTSDLDWPRPKVERTCTQTVELPHSEASTRASHCSMPLSPWAHSARRCTQNLSTTVIRPNCATKALNKSAQTWSTRDPRRTSSAPEPDQHFENASMRSDSLFGKAQAHLLGQPARPHLAQSQDATPVLDSHTVTSTFSQRSSRKQSRSEFGKNPAQASGPPRIKPRC